MGPNGEWIVTSNSKMDRTNRTPGIVEESSSRRSCNCSIFFVDPYAITFLGGITGTYAMILEEKPSHHQARAPLPKEWTVNIVFDLFEVWSPQKSGLISSVCGVCIYICVCVCIWNIQIHIHIIRYACIHLRVYAYVCICIYIYIYNMLCMCPVAPVLEGYLFQSNKYIYIYYYSNYYIDCIGDKCICICKWI